MANAHVTVSTARIADDFARSWIVRLFGADALAEIDAALPLYQRGKNAGRPKGTLKWWKAHTAGYARDVQSGVRPGTIRVELWTGFADPNSDVCFAANVLGRNFIEGPTGLDLPRLHAAGEYLKKRAA